MTTLPLLLLFRGAAYQSLSASPTSTHQNLAEWLAERGFDDHIPSATGFHHCAIAELVIRKYEKAGPTSVQAHTLVAE